MKNIFTLLFLSVAFLVAADTTVAQESICGSLKFHYGPFDYRTANQQQRDLVEDHHFSSKIENLSVYNPGVDIAYTLNAFPNHPRALMSLIRLAEKRNTKKAAEMPYSIECYFERAQRFRSDDATVKSLWGIYLIRTGKPMEAKAKLEEALGLAGDNANLYYNLGLAYFDLKDYEKSLESAHKAYAMGFPLLGLKNKLTRAGKWHPAPLPSGEKAITAHTELTPTPVK